MKEFNKDSVYLLGELIHDSIIKVGDLPTEPVIHQVNIKIRRSYWEKPIKKKILFCRITRFKGIESTIELRGIKDYTLNWRDSAFKSSNQILTIIEIRQRDKRLDFVTEYLDIRIDFLDDDYYIKFYDTSKPTEECQTTDIGTLFDYEIWERKYKKAAANKNAASRPGCDEPES